MMIVTMLALTVAEIVSPPCVPGYSQETFDYFRDVAMTPEMGQRYARPRRWSGQASVGVAGHPHEGDEEVIATVMADLAPLVRPLVIDRDDARPSITVHFVPRSEFRTLVPRYRGADFGLFRFSWDDAGAIESALVLISDELEEPDVRAHVIREELTQALGLPGDSRRYPESIFYSEWSSVTEFSALDLEVIRLLYDTAITDEQRMLATSCRGG